MFAAFLPARKTIFRRPTLNPSRSSARLELEELERRICFAGDTISTATPLAFAFQTAHVGNYLAHPGEVDLYRVHLGALDQINASINAQTAGSGLVSLLRVFDDAGKQIALDDQEGGDPQLTFQAPTAGDYFIGVSSAPNDNYNPQVAGSGTTGGTIGLYTLNLRDTPDATPQENLAGSSFRLGTDAAAWGDTVHVAFTVENRGAVAADGHGAGAVAAFR